MNLSMIHPIGRDLRRDLSRVVTPVDRYCRFVLGDDDAAGERFDLAPGCFAELATRGVGWCSATRHGARWRVSASGDLLARHGSARALTRQRAKGARAPASPDIRGGLTERPAVWWRLADAARAFAGTTPQSERRRSRHVRTNASQVDAFH